MVGHPTAEDAFPLLSKERAPGPADGRQYNVLGLEDGALWEQEPPPVTHSPWRSRWTCCAVLLALLTVLLGASKTGRGSVTWTAAAQHNLGGGGSQGGLDGGLSPADLIPGKLSSNEAEVSNENPLESTTSDSTQAPRGDAPPLQPPVVVESVGGATVAQPAVAPPTLGTGKDGGQPPEAASPASEAQSPGGGPPAGDTKTGHAQESANRQAPQPAKAPAQEAAEKPATEPAQPQPVLAAGLSPEAGPEAAPSANVKAHTVVERLGVALQPAEPLSAGTGEPMAPAPVFESPENPAASKQEPLSESVPSTGAAAGDPVAGGPSGGLGAPREAVAVMAGGPSSDPPRGDVTLGFTKGGGEGSSGSGDGSGSDGDSGGGGSGEEGERLVSCQRFTPAGCGVIAGKKRPLQYPTCQDPPGHVSPGGHECKFNLTQDLQLCPLPDRGLYYEEKVPEAVCSPLPFWQEGGLRPPRCAEGACCRADHIQGKWVQSEDGLGGLEFVEEEAMGCRFTRYTRRQVLQCMQTRSFLFLGDSMVRQLFSRLIDLFRGEVRSYESQRWRVQRYDVCESADLRSLAPAAPGVSPKDKSYILNREALITDRDNPILDAATVPTGQLLDMRDQHATTKQFPDVCGSQQPVTFQFLPATGFNPHVRFMTPYMAFHPDLSHQVFLTLVGYWELDVVEVPQQYYDILQAALDKGLQKLIVITIPLGMVIKQKWRKVFVSRNEQMRRWVNADTSGRVQLLDFDALSSAPNAPLGLTGNWTDWHYSCKFIWDTPENKVSAAEQAPDSDRWMDDGGYLLGDLNPNTALNCVDDINRVVLQVLFNLACNE